jgi:hypothetical protein
MGIINGKLRLTFASHIMPIPFSCSSLSDIGSYETVASQSKHFISLGDVFGSTLPVRTYLKNGSAPAYNTQRPTSYYRTRSLTPATNGACFFYDCGLQRRNPTIGISREHLQCVANPAVQGAPAPAGEALDRGGRQPTSFVTNRPAQF